MEAPTSAASNQPVEDLALPSLRVPLRVVPPEVAVRTFDECEPGYSREEAVLEARRAAGYDFTPAREACPFRVDVAELTRAVAAGDFDTAVGVVLQAHPWPSILGAHCQRPCDAASGAPPGVENILFSAIERAAGDHGQREKFPFEPGPPTGKRVTIIGSGSASSAATYRLRQRGHAVAIYEQLPLPGGMMVVGYPNFRLATSTVLRENDPQAWGVEMHCGARVDQALFMELRSSSDAVVIGTGLFKERRLGIPGEHLTGVWGALTFLTAFKLGRQPTVGKRVVVVGGGETAQDCARTCLRLGCDVVVLYWRGPTELRGGLQRRAELVEAEGGRYLYRTTVARALGRGHVSAVECVRTQVPRESTESDRAALSLSTTKGWMVAEERGAPVPIPSSNFTLPCDTLIEAVGERSDLSFLPSDIQLRDRQHVSVDDQTWMTTLSGVFAAGEVTGIVGTTMRAFWSGLRAAESVHAFLANSQQLPGPTARP